MPVHDTATTGVRQIILQRFMVPYGQMSNRAKIKLQTADHYWSPSRQDQ